MVKSKVKISERFIKDIHSLVLMDKKEDAGVFEDLIRVSVGIEDIEDLKADFAQAMETIAQR